MKPQCPKCDETVMVETHGDCNHCHKCGKEWGDFIPYTGVTFTEEEKKEILNFQKRKGPCSVCSKVRNYSNIKKRLCWVCAKKDRLSRG
ncbi:MAG: hypothetical protein PHW03_05435 [Eubacteriales bacterium]|nr:hypothetical protein [Eubacteriales bacterium]